MMINHVAIAKFNISSTESIHISNSIWSIIILNKISSSFYFQFNGGGH